MAQQGLAIHVIRQLARITPPLSLVLAAAFLAAAVAVGFFGAGGYEAGAAVTVALVLVLFAAVAFAIGRAVPAILKRLGG